MLITFSKLMDKACHFVCSKSCCELIYMNMAIGLKVGKSTVKIIGFPIRLNFIYTITYSICLWSIHFEKKHSLEYSEF